MPFETNLKAEHPRPCPRKWARSRAVNGSFPNTCFQREFFQEKFFVLIGPVESVHATRPALVGRRGVMGMNSGQITGCRRADCGRTTTVHSPSHSIPRCRDLSTWLSTGVNGSESRPKTRSAKRLENYISARKKLEGGSDYPDPPSLAVVRLTLRSLLDARSQFLDLVVHLATFGHLLANLLVRVHDRGVVPAERLADLG